ncbi:MAG: hypothetical protein U0Y10_04625 [Spirosomataceae bacterium]
MTTSIFFRNPLGDAFFHLTGSHFEIVKISKTCPSIERATFLYDFMLKGSIVINQEEYEEVKSKVITLLGLNEPKGEVKANLQPVLATNGKAEKSDFPF